MIPALMNGAPTGSVGDVNERRTGYIDSNLFLKWLKHFVTITNSTPASPHLLILDGHDSHKSLDAVIFCRENGVEMLSLPPHTSHRLQPLDRTFFKSLKSNYRHAIESWLITNRNRRVALTDVVAIFGSAYNRAATIGCAINGFRVTGIWPVDEHIFDQELQPSVSTPYTPSTSAVEPIQSAPVRPTPSSAPVQPTPLSAPVQPTPSSTTVQPTPLSATLQPTPSSAPVQPTPSSAPVQPTPSSAPVQPTLSSAPVQPTPSSTTVQPTPSSAPVQPTPSSGPVQPTPLSANVQPTSLISNILDGLFPTTVTPKQASNTRSRKQKSARLTSSPYKKSLEMKRDERKRKSEGKLKKGGPKNQKKARGNKGKCFPNPTAHRPQSESESDDEQWPCLVCCEPFNESKGGEVWIQCITCMKWAHEDCTPGYGYYECHNCESD